jgi:hypothetical protein
VFIECLIGPRLIWTLASSAQVDDQSFPDKVVGFSECHAGIPEVKITTPPFQIKIEALNHVFDGYKTYTCGSFLT